MKRIKLVLSDMDGTLVPFRARSVTERTHAAVGKLRNAGIVFAPATGRERCDILNFFFGDERCVETGIMGNGKLVYLNDELVLRRPLPKDQLEALVNAITPLPGVVLNCYYPLDERGRGKPGFFVCGATKDDFELIRSEINEDLSGGWVKALPAGSITTGAVIMASTVADVNGVHEIVREACPLLDFPIPGPHVFDIVERGWSKLSALPVLLEHLGLSVDEVAYLGDSQNDITMMEAIPNSFCMGDGSDDAKAAARWVVDTSVNDGAAQVMEALALSGGILDHK